MRRLLRRLPEPEVPPAFTESVMARVRAGEAEPPSVVRWLRRLAEPALAVPAAAAFAAVVVLVMQGGVVEPPSAGLEPAATLRVATVVADQAEPVAQEEEVDPAEDRHQYVREMQRRSLALRMARRGRPMEVARILRGAGHPYSPSFASHFEERDHPSVAAATWSPR